MEDLEEYIIKVTNACAENGHKYGLKSCVVCNSDDLDGRKE